MISQNVHEVAALEKSARCFNLFSSIQIDARNAKGELLTATTYMFKSAIDFELAVSAYQITNIDDCRSVAA